ncbi:hypothetical protein DL93DRAFT_2087448 [Clavulina sp. PMI_390]|nr:hypothetical protein DL93DRAFT_2087448 [Clavulina sp. PMI_390]
MELSNHGNQRIWLRIDRAANRNRDVRFTSRFPAEDTARVSSSEKHRLMIGESRLRAHVTFTCLENAPRLFALADLLVILQQESNEYRLFSENCYFFTSIIQETLTSVYGGLLRSGSLGHPNLGTEARERIRDRFIAKQQTAGCHLGTLQSRALDSSADTSHAPTLVDRLVPIAIAELDARVAIQMAWHQSSP